MRYSDTHKCEIRGDDCCPFWRVDAGGVCRGWPGLESHPCTANEDGTGCPWFKKET